MYLYRKSQHKIVHKMRRPNFRWMVKWILLLLATLIMFLLITSWISATPYTNRPRHHTFDAQPQPLPQAQAHPQAEAQHRKHADTLDSQRGNPVIIEAPMPVHVRKNIVEDAIDEVDDGSVHVMGARPMNDEDAQQPPHEVPVNQLLVPHLPKRDWHDYTAIRLDAQRVGIGEHGVAAKLDESLAEAEKKLSMENGFNALLSDSISVNRSLPDIRHKSCHSKLYVSKLPSVSVIIIYYNEYLSVLMRSVHSIINRSPPELIKEIILVDDFSDRAYLGKTLNDYIASHFKKVRVVRLTRRTGLIGARSAGARNATGEVLIFFDSHIEVNYNWLPPLLEPIALNKRTAVCPFIDVIDHATFHYRAQDEGARGGFDWQFFYKRLPLLDEDLKHPSEPFKSPVMAGGLFAISAEFFWELGGYDEGLDIWGGEQYELSFKIWMCGGEMYDAPCSRVGHIYRGPRTQVPSPRKGNYLHKNYKRVAEVWMDDYKKFLYDHADGIYEKVDAGDISAQKAIREKLKCKSFKWFMENVAFDLMNVYPPVDPPSYAAGALQNVGDPTMCVDTLGRKIHKMVGVYTCAKDLVKPQSSQYWELSWRRDLRQRRSSNCFDVQIWETNAPIWLWDCHCQRGNQYWYYDYKSKLLKHGESGKRCLEMLPSSNDLVANTCNANNTYMQWNFGSIDKEALDNYNKDLRLQMPDL